MNKDRGVFYYSIRFLGFKRFTVYRFGLKFYRFIYKSFGRTP